MPKIDSNSRRLVDNLTEREELIEDELLEAGKRRDMKVEKMKRKLSPSFHPKLCKHSR